MPGGTLSGVKTVGHWDTGEDQDWGLSWHRNEGIELTFLETGSLGFAVDGREYDLQPDDLTITRPWQRHWVGRPHLTAGRLHWLIVDVGVRRPNQDWKWPHWFVLSEPGQNQLTDLLRHNGQPVWRATPEIRRCFQAIAQAVQEGPKGGGVSRLAVRLNDLFILILEMLRAKRVRLDQSLSSTHRTVHLFLADLREHPGHLALEWSVQKMAESCGLGVTQFIHHVKALTNMTPVHYLNRYRLDLAARLLRTDLRVGITAVALTCGFSSSQYFATTFARKFDCSPREYRAH